MLVVNPAMPATTIAQLVALARSKPGQLTVSSSGNGSSGHLAAEYFKSVTGTNMLHVPYKGQAEAVNDVVAGRVDINFSAMRQRAAVCEGGAAAHCRHRRQRALCRPA